MTAPRTLMTGLIFGESPRWHDDRLWCIDMGAREVLAVDLEGKREVIIRVPTGLSAIDFLPDGRLLIAPWSGRQLLRRDPDGSLVAYADLSRLFDTPWNDMVVDGRGNAYVGNLGFRVGEEEFQPGLIALVTPDGATRQVANDIAFANGMVVTPDNRTLIIAETRGARLTAFDITAEGGLSNRRVWADLDGGHPDGICLDADSAVWYGDPRGGCVRVREGGEILQRLDVGPGCFACMLGGVDRSTLFLMVSGRPDPSTWGTGDPPRTGQVLAVEAPAPGVGWP
jgi:sugar lactone lactonase YvrE